MAQPAPGDFPIDPTTTSGDILADILNRQFEWINTTNSGATPPQRTFPGQLWLDTSVTASPDGVLRLRNGANNAWIAIINSAAIVNFTPVRQGAGPGQGTNTVSIGWSASLGKVLISVDNNPFGNAWPITVEGSARGIRSAGAAAGAEIYLNWSDPGDVPAYLHGGHSPTDARVVPPSRLTVNRAASAGYADNAGAVNGISGWAYSNQNYNPPYLWSTAGSGTSQFLVQPGNLSVNYANSANTANYAASAGSVGRAANSDNADRFQGRQGEYWLNNGDSAVRNLRNNATIQLLTSLSGYGDVWWAVNPSDERLKKDIAPTVADSLADIEQMQFKQFRFRDDVTTYPVDDGRLHPVGLIAQEMEQVSPAWVNNLGSFKQPDQYALLMTALHGIQQLIARVRGLEGRNA